MYTPVFKKRKGGGWGGGGVQSEHIKKEKGVGVGGADNAQESKLLNAEIICNNGL